MSAITARGTQAKENANKKNRVDTKKIYLRLKENQGHKVRVLGVMDYVEYQAVGDYNLGIYTQPVSENSPLLVAHQFGGEKFKNLYKKPRYVFVFASLETGELVALECSKNQAKALISNIDEYSQHINTVAFNLKKTGSDTNTGYALNPMLSMSPEEKAVFDKFDGQTVEDSFFEDIIQPKGDQFLAKLLKEAGFDVETYLPHIKIDEDNGTEPDTSAEAIEENGSDEDLLSHI